MSDDKTEVLQSLLNELSAGMADVVSALQNKTESSEEISATLVDMLEAVKAAAQGQSLGEVVAAIKSLRVTSPAVNVSVQPTPITNLIQPTPVQILERATPNPFRCHDLKYDRHDRLESFLISPVLNPTRT